MLNPSRARESLRAFAKECLGFTPEDWAGSRVGVYALEFL